MPPFDPTTATSGTGAPAPVAGPPPGQFDPATASPAGTRSTPRADAPGPWYSEFGAGMSREAQGMAAGAQQLIHGETPPEYRGWLSEYQKPDPSWWTTLGRGATAIGGPGLAGLAAAATLPEAALGAAGLGIAGLSGAIMPTASGTRLSHVPGAALGFGAGWAGSKLAGLLGKAPYLRDLAAWNRDAYSWILENSGIAVPKVAGTKAIAEMATGIGAKLDAANAQLSFNPSSNAFRAALARIRPQFVQSPGASSAQWGAISNGVLGDLQTLARRGGGTITGADFAEYVTGLNTAARSFAESAASGSERGADLRLLAKSLNAITEAMETSATGPAAARAERAAARQAWSRFAQLADEQSAVTGGMAKPSQLIGALEKQEGKIDYARTPSPFKDRLAAAQAALEKAPRSGFLGHLIDLAAREGAYHLGGFPAYIGARIFGPSIGQAVSAGLGKIPASPAGALATRGLTPGISAIGGETLNSLADRAIGGR
jgi:hypothetical protein